jgi:Na+-translocating ferredoxin:NAD+ oxidoreductase RnfG subunit
MALRIGALAFVIAVLAAAARADDVYVYLKEDEAPAAVFPAADRFERREVGSTEELQAGVQERLGKLVPSIWEDRYPVITAYEGSRKLGRAVIVEEIGKHRGIRFVVGVDPSGAVAGVAILVYREHYGGEVRDRRFLAQYRGKRAGDSLRPGREIRNIAGATLSAQAIGRGVKKALAVLEEIPE